MFFFCTEGVPSMAISLLSTSTVLRVHVHILVRISERGRVSNPCDYVLTPVRSGERTGECGTGPCRGRARMPPGGTRSAATAHDLLPPIGRWTPPPGPGGPTTLCTTTPFEKDPCCMPSCPYVRAHVLSTPRLLLNPYVHQLPLDSSSSKNKGVRVAMHARCQ